MKSYTDIEQSKKLVELGIDIDTADMYHSIIPESITNENGYAVYNINILKSAISFSDIKKTLENVYSGYKGPVPIQFIPCWSLAALLEVLNSKIYSDEDDEYTLYIYKDSDKYSLSYINEYGTSKDIELGMYDDFVDCCYDMIIKLHELNLI